MVGRRWSAFNLFQVSSFTGTDSGFWRLAVRNFNRTHDSILICGWKMEIDLVKGNELRMIEEGHSVNG